MLITRAADDAEPLRSRLAAYGAEAVLLPALEIRRPLNLQPLDTALRDLAVYDWIAFTSRHAVDAVFDRLQELRAPLPPDVRVAAVGASTAARLSEQGIEQVLTPPPGDARAFGLGTAMARTGMEGMRVLFPAGDLARPELQQVLEGAGARVDRVTAYRIVPADGIDTSIVDDLCHGRVDIVAFASPSAVHTVASLLRADAWCLRRARIACIGDTTAAAISTLDAEIHPWIGKGASVDGLVNAIVAAYNGDST